MNFCFVSWINWDSYLHSRPHQLVREALRRGHTVLYLNPGMRPALRDGNLEVWHPLSQPFFNIIKKILRGELLRDPSPNSVKKVTPMRGWVYRSYEEGNRKVFLSRYLIDFLTRQKLRAFRDRRGRNIIVFEQPFPFVYQIPYLKKLGYIVIYDLIDDWTTYQDAPRYFIQTEPYLLKTADIVTVTARTLHKRAVQYNENTYLCPNAADVAHFSKARGNWEKPGDLPVRRPRIGFFGVLREWFDAELVEYSAVHRPEYEFCLIGGYSEDIRKKLAGLSNVHLLGEKPYLHLPEYLHHFDVAIIPFKVNDLIRSTNPIKVYEYLAGGKPVVATDIPEIEGMPFVYLSKNVEEFDRNLHRAIETSVDLEKIDGFLTTQTWGERFNVIEGAILELS